MKVIFESSEDEFAVKRVLQEIDRILEDKALGKMDAWDCLFALKRIAERTEGVAFDAESLAGSLAEEVAQDIMAWRGD